MKRLIELYGFSFLSVLSILLIMACSVETTSEVEDPLAGKADDAACIGAALDDHGYCRLPNGQFAFARCCETQEPVCDTAVQQHCIFGVTSHATETLGYLECLESVWLEPGDSLDTLLQEQIVAAMIATECDWVEDLASAFEATDDGFRRQDVIDSETGEQYRQLTYFAGDTEVGVFFRAGTTEVVALIGDGETYDCTAFMAANREDPCEEGPTATEAVVQRVLASKGITEGMQLSFDEWEVNYQLGWDGEPSFGDALRVAIDSFLNDGSDIESPRSLLEDADDDPECPQNDPADRLRCYMSRADSHLALVPQEPTDQQPRVYPPENGEDVEDNWVFFLTMDRLSDHLFWAVVDRTELSQVTNYGFN